MKNPLKLNGEQQQALASMKEFINIEHLPKQSATWDDYFELNSLFAPMDYAYALTVHKSQGSTFDNVMVDSPDIMRNPKERERHQCLYVACSRAAKRLLIASSFGSEPLVRSFSTCNLAS